MSRQRPEEAYSEEEFRRIMDAAARDGAPPGGAGGAGAGEGYTLPEMVEIAREAGIDPAAVTRAASDVRRSRGAPPGRPGVLGGLFPRLVHREAELPRRLTDAEMQALAHEADHLQGGRGHLRAAGDWVEWRDPSGRAYLGVVREEGRTRFRAIADQAPDLVVGATATGFLGLLLVAVAEGAFGGGGLVTVVLVTAGIYGVLRWQASWLTRRTLRRLDDWLDRVRAAVD